MSTARPRGHRAPLGPSMVLPDPMLLSEDTSPLDKPGWIYEIKYDG